MHQGRCDLTAGAPDDAIKGLPRYSHAFCGLGMIEILVVGQTHHFEFTGPELDLLQLVEQNASGL